MNTFWLKLTAAAVGIVVIIVLIGTFTSKGSNQSQPKQPEKTFYDQARKDKQDLIPSKDEEKAISNGTPINGIQQPNNVSSPAPVVAQAAPVQPQPKEITIYVKPLSENEKIEAEREINYEAPMFSIGRLPGSIYTPSPSYKPAIDSARRILNRWPDSIYAYKAKEMLAKIPDRYHDQYHITAEELDTSMFMKPKAGTVPVKVKIEE